MYISKKNKKGAALITGGAIRLGKVFAKAIAEDGYDIVLHYNSSDMEAEKTAEEIRKCGVNCIALQADLADSEQSEKLIEKAMSEYEHLNVLINSASIFERNNFMQTDEDIFDRHMNINFKAPFFLTQNFAKLCRNGVVINILDTYVKNYTPAHFIYLISKKALMELTKMSARELAPDIRVNAICPSSIFPSKLYSPKYVKEKAEKLPLGKNPSLEDLAKTLLFLVNSDFLTGECIFVDGGHKLV